MLTPKIILKNILRKISPYRFPLFRLTRGHRFPVHIDMKLAEAESLLQSVHPDDGQSSLCHNEINPIADLHIIIPVYNVRRFVEECLDSVYSQQTHFSFFVSIIDDGSTDGSSDFLDEYCSKLQETELHKGTELIHQLNRGLAMARNRGLANIRGRYVTFVDSDDMLMPGAIESLISAAIEQRADIAEGNCNTGSTYGMACGKVYSAQLFRNIHFPPGYWFEDTINIFILYQICHKRINVDGCHYYYRNNTSSTMHSFQNNSRALDSLWVSRRVLWDYFALGYSSTDSLLYCFLNDTLSTATHISTLQDERIMQALFIVLHNMACAYFYPLLTDKSTLAHLPYILRKTALALFHNDYRQFRIAQAAACKF